MPTSRSNYYKTLLTGVAIAALAASTTYLFIQNKRQQKLILEHTRYIDELRASVDRSRFTDNFNTYLNSVFNDRWTSLSKFFSNMENQVSTLRRSIYSNNLDENIHIVNHVQEYIVTAALPGFYKEEITINLLGFNLEISAQHPAPAISDNDTNEENKSEKHAKQVKYNIAVPDNIDPNNINAQLNNGLLTIKFFKRIDQTDIEPKTILID